MDLKDIHVQDEVLRKAATAIYCPEHTFCPQSHGLLGIQIGFVAVLLPLVFGFVFLGYRVADRGLDLFERGQKLLGLGLFLGTALLTVAGTFGILSGGYWFAFEGGASRLLGIGF